MTFRRSLSALAMAFLVTAAPASAQLVFLPDYALPSSGETPMSWISANYGRGLNDASGKGDAVAAMFGRANGRVSVAGGIGYFTEGDGELTLGAAVGVDLNTGPGPRLSLQGGFGWLDFDMYSEPLTLLRFPVGLALKGDLSSGAATVTPWIMPRLNISRASLGNDSHTETDFGASGGLSILSDGGVGVDAALDALFLEDTTVWQLGVGLRFRLGGTP